MTRKAVIVAAGYGTRFLPITKVVPKELLPLVDRPCLDHVVQELVDAGIEDLLVITSRRKRAIEDWFDRDPELEQALHRAGRTDRLARCAPPALRVQTVRQQQMRGTGHALLLAKEFAGDDPVIVAFPDDLFLGGNGTAELLEVHRRTGSSVLAAADLGDADVSAYGVLEVAEDGPDLAVRRFVEKPAPGTAPSSIISVGRYLYTPEIFGLLAEGWSKHTDGEFYTVDALNALAANGRLHARVCTAERRDTGDLLGYLTTAFDVALDDPRVGPDLQRWLEARLAKA